MLQAEVLAVAVPVERDSGQRQAATATPAIVTTLIEQEVPCWTCAQGAAHHKLKHKQL